MMVWPLICFLVGAISFFVLGVFLGMFLGEEGYSKRLRAKSKRTR